MPMLQVIQGPEKGRTFRLSQEGSIIGREGCTVGLSDRTASRQHAQLARYDGQWVLEDLGSANGTFLNGTKITRPTPLKSGDQVRCGQTLLVLTGDEIDAAPEHVELDDNQPLVEATVHATVPSSHESVIIPTPEAGAAAIGNLRILYDLIRELSSVLDVDVLLRRALDKAFESLLADRGYVMLVRDDGKLVLKASRFAVGADANQIPVSKTIIKEVLAKKVGVLSTNAMADKRFSPGESVHDYRIRSAICVPIMGRERILGIMHVDCAGADRTYSTNDLRLLTAIGYQTGLAIENVKLHQATVQSARLAAVGETVAVLSHHIKNVLHALSAGIDVVEMALDHENLAKAKGAWPIVERNLKKINDLILNMLAFSKSREPLLKDVKVNQIVAEAVELHHGVAEERGVALLSDLEDLPPIAVDPDGLGQAVHNLISNALDAVKDATGAITVRTRHDPKANQVLISVIDNGSGIPAKRMEQIFNPFYSAKGHRGTGLGLAVAKKVVGEHGGQIKVSSKVKQGTTFTIALPARPNNNVEKTVVA